MCSDSTSDTQLQSDSTGNQRILPPINQPNLVGDRNNPSSPLKPEKDAVVKDGIPVPKSNKGGNYESSSHLIPKLALICRSNLTSSIDIVRWCR